MAQSVNKMNLSCLPVSLFKAIQRGELSICDWAHEAKNAGLDAFDLSIMLIRDHTPVYLEKLKEDLAKEEIPLLMVTAYPDFTHPSELQRDREEAYFIRDIALSSFLGAKYLRITSGQAHPEVTIDQGIEYTLSRFKKMVDVADKFNIKLLYENHKMPGS